MKTIIHTSLLSFVVLSIRADLVVVPPDRATQSGNTFISEAFRQPGTFQTVYSAPNFSGPVLINSMAFRMEEASGGSSIQAVIPRVTVQNSTFSGTPSSFEPFSYDANKGADEMTAYDSGVQWTTTDLPDFSPNPFDLKLVFSRPFFYDPSKGSVLINFTSSGDFTSGVAVDLHSHGRPDVGWVGNTGASLVTQFDVTPVPEPNAFILLLFGALALRVARKS
jgi:hypothetical protein